MAELHVQPKKNKLWWLWILIVLVILALVYFYFRGNNNQMAASETAQPTQATYKICAPVRVQRERETIYSKTIVKYIRESKMVPVKLYHV